LKYRKHKDESQFLHEEFLKALYGNEPDRRHDNRQAQRKTQQFCRQVQRALNLALESATADGIDGVFVDAVSPGPDCGRLLVYVVIPPEHGVSNAIEALRRVAPQLRAEVARAITRKRAPELAFVPVGPEGGFDE
jgi:ribosome-binding factor A